MVISGDAIIIRKYFDDVTLKNIEVEMSVKDHLLMRRLEQLENALRRQK